MNLNWANRFTILRILLIAPFVSCMLQMNDPTLSDRLQHILRYIAFGIFFLMAISDAIDGLIARKTRQITKLGAFLDPTADKLLITAACLLLASKHSGVDGFLIPPTVVVLIIGKDILIFIGFLIVYFLTSKVRIVPVFAGKLSTVLQLSMVIATLIAPEVASVFPPWANFVRFLWWSAAAAAVLAALIYIRNGSKFIEQFEKTNNQ